MNGTAGATNGSQQQENFDSAHRLSYAFLVSLLAHLLLMTLVPKGIILAASTPKSLPKQTLLQVNINANNNWPRDLISVAPRTIAPRDIANPKSSAQKTRKEPMLMEPSQPQDNSVIETDAPPELLAIKDDQLIGLEEGTKNGGQIMARLIINEKGQVKYLTVLSSSLAPEIEAQVVLRLYRASYRPGEKNGHPVASSMFLEINVSPEIPQTTRIDGTSAEPTDNIISTTP